MTVPVMQIGRVGVTVSQRLMLMLMGVGDTPAGKIQAGMLMLVVHITGVGMGMRMGHQYMLV